MKYIFFALALICFSYGAIGQEFEGRVELYGDRYIESDAIIVNKNYNYITFQSNIDNESIDFKKSRIRSIQRRDGNYFVTGILAGAIVSPILYHCVVGYDKFSTDSFMITNLIGVVFGTTLGLITPKYTQIYGDMDTRLAVLDRVEIMPGTYQYKVNVLSLNLNLD